MDVPAALQPYVRTAWLPETAEEDGPRTASKLGGTAWIPADETWPACPNCGRSLQLLLQLNPDDLPEAVRGEVGEGLVQLFYCTSQDPLCEVDCEAFFPFSASVVARRVVPDGEGSEAVPDLADPFPPRRVVGWRPVDDLPVPEDAPELSLPDEVWDEVYRHGLVERDKLAGWPTWIQGPERPACPRCGTEMRVVFQIVSDDTLPILFGDMGTGHLTRCPEHADVLTFGWACT
ncbi:DUF1963 domain-containing protein [Rubrivirga marina]|uniref:DUF1963 domain-containing protein n=1 Tax=Rubrivirga marina TaxID=1196024 RepID=A0A271J0M4_9BACT|nr:DUF1963 domain-containing protein [Rubrivirga marina]PAP76505.1 hypothetical protein BSZ37_08655 [Rubrivirga marina]